MIEERPEEQVMHVAVPPLPRNARRKALMGCQDGLPSGLSHADT